MVVIDLPESDLRGQHTLLELQGVELARRAVAEVVDQVLAIALAKQVGVVAQAAVQGVIARATIECVRSVAAVQVVVALASKQHVITNTARQGVVTALPIDQVVARTPVEGVGAGVPGIHIVIDSPRRSARRQVAVTGHSKCRIHFAARQARLHQCSQLGRAIPACAVECLAIGFVDIQKQRRAFVRVCCTGRCQCRVHLRKVQRYAGFRHIQLHHVHIFRQAHGRHQIVGRIVYQTLPKHVDVRHTAAYWRWHGDNHVTLFIRRLRHAVVANDFRQWNPHFDRTAGRPRTHIK